MDQPFRLAWRTLPLWLKRIYVSRVNIVLIGYRGSGKTATGRILAQRLGWTFVDTDASIEQRAGRSIRDIFAEQGEPAFRDLESQVIREVAGGDRQVISAGGGAVLRAENVAALRSNDSAIVWLTAPSRVLHRRIEEDAASHGLRPNLTSSGGLEEVRELLRRRFATYRSACTLRVVTTHRTPEQVAGEIAKRLGL
jgi:shikimate kinase